MKPDADAMLDHVEHLFGGDLDGLHEGRIELAWTDSKDGNLKYARTFGTDELNELVDEAVEVNSIEGQNVFISAALRKPETARIGRCTDNDFYGLTAYYVDLDDVGAAKAAHKRCGKHTQSTSIRIKCRCSAPKVLRRINMATAPPQRLPS